MSKGIILNIDESSATWPFLRQIMENGAVSKETLYPFVDQYIDLPDGRPTQLAGIAFNTFCQFSCTPSKYQTDYFVFGDTMIKNGFSIDAFDFAPIYRINKDYGLDAWGIWIERCRERGYEAWLSIRMNDAHDLPYADNHRDYMMQEYAFRAKWQGYAIGDRYGYYWKCLDYAIPEVRQRMLDYLAEQLDRYHVDVLELDFMREIYCFKYLENPDCADIMNSFMRKVKEIVDAAGRKWGHNIRISTRLAREIDQNLIWGMDVETWAREGLVDHITVTPRWSSNDSAMPIAEWVRRFPQIEIAAGVETLMLQETLDKKIDGYIQQNHIDLAGVNGLAANYYSQGAVQLNLYNFFVTSPDWDKTAYCKRTMDVLAQCGSEETVFSAPRRHIVLYQDIAPEGCTRYMPLPLTVSADKEASVVVHTGIIPAGKTIRLILGFSKGSPDTTDISVNGTSCTAFAETEIMSLTSGFHPQLIKFTPYQPTINGYVNDGVALYACTIAADPQSGKQTVSFTAASAEIETKIAYIEIAIS